jgi:hypothetical protein
MEANMRLSLAAATALVGALYLVSPAAKAGVITFGDLTPTPACGPVSGTGSVCGFTASFTSGLDTVVAAGFTGGPGIAADTLLTLKPMPLNVLSESGLGVQDHITAAPCTDPDCEIAPPQSVAVSRSGSTLITDALIGSVQAGESFNFFVQTTDFPTFTMLNTAPITNTCSFPGGFVAGTDLCGWNAPTGQTRFGVAVQAVVGDVLLTSVSTLAAVPLPAALPLFASGLIGLGLLGWRRKKAAAG